MFARDQITTIMVMIREFQIVYLAYNQRLVMHVYVVFMIIGAVFHFVRILFRLLSF